MFRYDAYEKYYFPWSDIDGVVMALHSQILHDSIIRFKKKLN